MNRAIIFIIAGLIYLIWPADLIPDFFGVVGWVDDILVLGFSIYMAVQSLRKRVRQGPQHAGNARREVPGAFREKPVLQDPYEILGISSDASKNEIKEAYRREMAKYHPDKVEHLGKEFKAIAEEKAKALQEAYTRLTKEGS